MTDENEIYINLDGIPIPGSMAAKAVRRCIKGINHIDRLINKQGFASEEDLLAVRADLSGESEDAGNAN